MPLVQTADLQPGQPIPDSQQVYNALDCCLTWEIHQTLAETFPGPNLIYDFERALQAPALEIMQRGWLVDEWARQDGIESLRRRIAALDTILQRMSWAVWGRGLNPRSTKQLQDFFYHHMHLPEQWISQKGEKKLSMGIEVLEKLEQYFYAGPIIRTILAIRDLTKQLEVFESQIDPDGRFRFSINIAGTTTGRWSSSKSSTGSGRNSQNIDEALRHIFIADPGWKICGIDQEQAESRLVGWLCGTICNDWSYYDACLSGDLHSLTAKLIWPNLDWTDDPKTNRAIAETKFYHDYSYRDMSKRGGHGSNYYGTPFTLARHLKVKTSIMEDFQKNYFIAFPGIPRWHRWVAQQLQTTQQITTVFGRQRHFFGRPNDDTTLREAIAFDPQSSVADYQNLIVWRLWRYMGPRIRLLGQVHDAVYFLFRETDDEAEVVQTALSYFQTGITSGSRTLLVPGEAKTGWNWGNYSSGYKEANPYGLKKFKGQDDRKRPPMLGFGPTA